MTYTSLTFTYSTGPKGVHLRESQQYKKFVEKLLFMVKMKTTCYTLSLTSSMMNVMFCISTISVAVGQSAISHVNLDACYLPHQLLS